MCIINKVKKLINSEYNLYINKQYINKFTYNLYLIYVYINIYIKHG